ncbi:MAG: LAGLIDADG family homing endonuclease [Parcubacteria group bacterium]
MKISTRNLSDWKQEKLTLPLSTVKTICKKADLHLPRNIKFLSPYWYTKKGARKGGLAIVKKYGSVGGDPKKRLQKWHEWWGEKGRFQKHPILGKRLSTKKPRPSVKLAEFIGIMLGDGGISQRQVSISLNRESDREYIEFVKKIIITLFGVSPSLYPDPKSKADTIVISRTELVEYLTQKLGLKIGNKIKQQIDIPTWIKKNSEYKIACVRGLVDTDGSVYKHRYTVKNKTYSYQKLSFCSLSPPLLLSVFETLKNIGLKPRICKDKEIKIENTQNVRRYFEIIGSNNKKHLKKIEK